MNQLVIKVGPTVHEQWATALASELPDYEILRWGQVSDFDSVRYAGVWQPESGELARFTSLRAIVSLAAGTDHILRDPELPPDIPIYRLASERFISRMTEYVLAQTLWLHRDLHRYGEGKATATWQRFGFALTSDQRKVGVMGLGGMGEPAARALATLGFDVRGWRARADAAPIAGVKSFHGRDELSAFIKQLEILICMLPLTDQTHDILDGDLFAQLPRGARLINVGRGEHLVEADLIRALDSGQLSVAILDVFRKEPLPDTHPFWHHPGIIITPHVASLIDPVTGAAALAREIRLLDANEASEI